MKDYLKNNEDETLKVLSSLDLVNFRYNPQRKEVRFSREVGSNPTGNVFNLSTLSFISYSTNDKGDIYTLVMNKLGISFPDAVAYILNVLGLKNEEFAGKVKLPFGGFYKELSPYKYTNNILLPTYPESILDKYSGRYNTQFLNDGISFETQKKFNIGIDLDTYRITVPQYTSQGELCGIMGRSLDKDCPHESRWLPIIACQRSLTLYGYHQNYAHIAKKDMCIVFESEKAVCQLDSFGCNLGLATCGCHLSTHQSKLIKSLGPKRIILAYDEGIKEEQLIEAAEKLVVDNGIMKNHVGYIWDKNNDIIASGSKDNIADVGKYGFTKAIKEKVRWIS